MEQKPVVVTNSKMLRAATVTFCPCLLPVWFAWLIGRLQTHGLTVREEDGSCEAPYVAWLYAKLAQHDAKTMQKLAKAREYVDLRRPVLEQQLELTQALPGDDEVALRRMLARRTALETERAELQALSDKAAELAAARHAQVAAKIPPRIKAFVQGISHHQTLDQVTVTARLCAAYDHSV